MSNYSDYLEAAEKLQRQFNADTLTEGEKIARANNLYGNFISLALVKIADDIHKISKTLDEMNRRKS